VRVVLAVVAIAAGLAASASVGASTPQSLIGVRYLGDHDTVVERFDPTSLRRLGTGRRLGMLSWPWSWSPDRSRIAFAGGKPRQGFTLVVLEAKTLRVVDTLSGPYRLPVDGSAVALQEIAWLPGNRLVVITWDEVGATTAHVVDLATRTVRSSVALEGNMLASGSTARAYVGLLGPSDRIGRARVVALDRDLRVTEVALDRIRAGTFASMVGGSEEIEAKTRIPALAVDPSGRRAVVVGLGEPIADVDLDAGTVRYHATPVRAPARAAKSTVGPVLFGTWLSSDAVAVTGTIYGGGNDRGRQREKPFGVRLLDLATWRMATVDPDNQMVALSGPYLVTLRPNRELQWFTHAGKEAGRLVGIRPITDYAVAGSRALVRLAGESRVALVDLRTGRVIEHRPRSERLALPAFLPR